MWDFKFYFPHSTALEELKSPLTRPPSAVTLTDTRCPRLTSLFRPLCSFYISIIRLTFTLTCTQRTISNPHFPYCLFPTSYDSSFICKWQVHSTRLAPSHFKLFKYICVWCLLSVYVSLQFHELPSLTQLPHLISLLGSWLYRKSQGDWRQEWPQHYR